ncbi:hypothetical protein [Romboutsia sp. 1001713B170131_170501_G6]|uniref:hypothetical protein n=1 Tax=Romboutsia sp. 1001713B170131_170501_G6 TaxID=2787108 RepID=UPI0018AB2BB9|nr:hypothetical protein [Romboutsia sp. 1001713B170131_170501_G6]
MISKQKTISYVSHLQRDDNNKIKTINHRVRNSIVNTIEESMKQNNKTIYKHIYSKDQDNNTKVNYIKRYSIDSPIIAPTTFRTRTITESFNSELSSFHDQFKSMNKTTGSRNLGVSNAWKYEYAEVKMGGEGTRNWTNEQKIELLENGKVKYMEGHHINNVSHHAEQQSNPNNIKFLNREEHLLEHHGDFRNETKGKMYDRDQRLIKVNSKRVIKNEIYGLGTAAAIGLGIGFTIGFLVSLSQNDLNPNSIKYAFITGTKSGIESSAMAMGGHIIGRSIGSVASDTLTSCVIGCLGKNIAEETLNNIYKMCNIGVVGTLSIAIFSIYQFTKMKMMGLSTKECLIRTGKSVGLSFSVLILSIVAQGIYGGSIGVIVSVVAGIIMTGKILKKEIKTREIAKKITTYSISLTEPLFA